MKLGLFFFFVAFYFSLAQANSESPTGFILSPSNEDLVALSRVSEVSNFPLAVQVVFNPLGQEFAYGIAIPKAARNGIHLRLLSEVTGLPLGSQLKEKWFFGGTLFLEQQDGKPVLGFHSRNSIRSTMNDDQPDYVPAFPVEVLQKIANLTQLPIKSVSPRLQEVIDWGNLMRNGYTHDSVPFGESILPHRSIGLNSIKARMRSLVFNDYSNIGPEVQTHAEKVDFILADRAERLMFVPKANGNYPLVPAPEIESAEEYIRVLSQALQRLQVSQGSKADDQISNWVDFTDEFFLGLEPTEAEVREYKRLRVIVFPNESEDEEDCLSRLVG